MRSPASNSTSRASRAACGRSAPQLRSRCTDAALWTEIKLAYDQIVSRRPDSDFYRTFFNSVTRDTVRHGGRKSRGRVLRDQRGPSLGRRADPRLSGRTASLPAAVRELLGRSAVRRPALRTRTPRCTASAPRSGAISRPDGKAARRIRSSCIEPRLLSRHARLRRRAASSATAPSRRWSSPSAIRTAACGSMPSCCRAPRSARLFGYARSYFHVDLPVVSAAITLLRSFMPRKPIDELYTVARPRQAGQDRALFRAAAASGIVHRQLRARARRARPGDDRVHPAFARPGLQGHPRPLRRAQDEHPRRRHGALPVRVPPRPRRTSRRCPGIQAAAAAARPLHAGPRRGTAATSASQSCRIEGDDLIVEHCYIERRLRPLNLFLREAEPAAAEAAIIDYGNALRDLAASNVFPGDLLLKNFGVTSHGRVIFYDYDELCLVTDCVFRDSAQHPPAMRRRPAPSRGSMCGPQRRVSGTMAALSRHPAGAARSVSASPRRIADGRLVARGPGDAASERGRRIDADRHRRILS